MQGVSRPSLQQHRKGGMAVEDFLTLIMVVLAIVSAISKNKKKAERARVKKAAQTQKPSTLEQSIAQWFDEAATAKPEAPAKPAEAAVPAGTGSIKEATHEGIHPCEEHPVAPKQVAQPRVQTRVQVTEKPAVIMGSMGEDTHEGLHPCDDHDDAPMQGMGTLAEIPVEKPGVQLDWSGDNMVKAFIMQEVLTRPCQRRRA